MEEKRPTQRWFQFNLRTLFIIMTVIAVYAGVLAYLTAYTQSGGNLSSYRIDLEIAFVVLVPLGILVAIAGQLLRAGVAASDLTDLARQKLVGLAMVLFYITIPLCLLVTAMGFWGLIVRFFD